jgi:AraC-like DNA-binding protein
MFNTGFETSVIKIKGKFVRIVETRRADAAVVCCCSSERDQMATLEQLGALNGPLPVVVCTKALNTNFVQASVQKGVNRFLECTMDPDEIAAVLHEAIHAGGLKGYLQSLCPGGLAASHHVRKMVDEIMYTFPQRLKEPDMAGQLGISVSTLQKHCRDVFGKTYTRLLRRIWVHQALRLMKHTNFDNTEIALHLNYSEESSMARDFRKELDYNPTEARRRLVSHSPEELMR